MLTLPDGIAPASATPEPVSFSFNLRPASGAELLHVDRPGDRFKIAVNLPPLVPEKARLVLSRLQRGRREGLRLVFPLLGASQGSPGAPVIDGAEPAGTTLALRGVTPGYIAKEGYWLTLVDGDDRRCLHQVSVQAMADAAGDMVLQIEPPIHQVFADGDAVLLARPTIEGLVTELPGWTLPANRRVMLTFTIEEVG